MLDLLERAWYINIMEMLPSLTWFVLGAALALGLRYIVYYNEQRKMFVQIITNYIILMSSFKGKMVAAQKLSQQYLRESGKSEEEIEMALKAEQDLINGWEVLCTGILFNALPARFRKLLER